MMSKFLFLLFLTLNYVNLTFITNSAEEEGSIKFYNVGGHCALVTLENRVPLLCDAGANSFRVIDPNRVNLVQPIVNDILQMYTDNLVRHYDRSYPLSIIISHPSKDHYDFIPDILTSIRAAMRFPLRMRVVLGGDRGDYGLSLINTFIDFHRVQTNNLNGPINENDFMCFSQHTALNTPAILDWLQFKQRANGEDAWVGPSMITHLFGQTDLGIMPHGVNMAAINDMKSLIVRVEIPDWTAVLPGDALNVQTNILIENEVELTSDILHSSLQGGGVNLNTGLNRANSQAWAQHVDPRFVVISAGSHGTHRHPRADAMNRYDFQGGRLEDVGRHYIHYYEDANPLVYARPNPAPINTQYGGLLARTKKAVYNTFSSGDITFSTANNMPALAIAPANLPAYLP